MKWKYNSFENAYFAYTNGIYFAAVPYKKKGKMRLSVRVLNWGGYRTIGTSPAVLNSATKLVIKFLEKD